MKRTVPTRPRGRSQIKQLEKMLFEVRKRETVSASQVLLELEETTEVQARSGEADVVMPRAQI